MQSRSLNPQRQGITSAERVWRCRGTRAVPGVWRAANTWVKYLRSFFSTYLHISLRCLTSSPVTLFFLFSFVYFFSDKSIWKGLLAACFFDYSLRLNEAGSGSQVGVYDLEVGKIVRSFCVFQGIRVHGLFCCEPASLPSELAFKLVVFGERRVKLFSLRIRTNAPKPLLDITLVQLLPKFSNWVLDVCFLRVPSHLSFSFGLAMILFYFYYFEKRVLISLL